MVKILDCVGNESHFDVVFLLDNTNKHLKKWFKKKTGCDYDTIVKRFYETSLKDYDEKVERCFQKCFKQLVKKEHEIINFDNNICLSKVIKLKVFLFLYNLFGIRTISNSDHICIMQGDFTKNVLRYFNIVKKYDYTYSCDFLHFFDTSFTLWKSEFEYLKKYECCSTYRCVRYYSCRLLIEDLKQLTNICTEIAQREIDDIQLLVGLKKDVIKLEELTDGLEKDVHMFGGKMPYLPYYTDDEQHIIDYNDIVKPIIRKLDDLEKKRANPFWSPVTTIS